VKSSSFLECSARFCDADPFWTRLEAFDFLTRTSPDFFGVSFFRIW
jgi:hypothetical protein